MRHARREFIGAMTSLGLLASCGGGGGSGTDSGAGTGGIPTPTPAPTPTPTPSGASGLDFPGDQGVNRRFTRVLPKEIPPPYPLTVIFQVFPRRKSTAPGALPYQTVFFHGVQGDFLANTDRYYGAGPYPVSATETRWEIAANGNDFTGDIVQYDRWYQCAFIASAGAAGKQHRFYYDLPDTSKVIAVDLPAGYFAALAPTHSFTWGDAPWQAVTDGPTKEQLSGILRRLKIFTAPLSVADATSEATSDAVVTASGAASLWYLNANPRPDDLGDRAGAGHDFEWYDPANRARPWP